MIYEVRFKPTKPLHDILREAFRLEFKKDAVEAAVASFKNDNIGDAVQWLLARRKEESPSTVVGVQTKTWAGGSPSYQTYIQITAYDKQKTLTFNTRVTVLAFTTPKVYIHNILAMHPDQVGWQDETGRRSLHLPDGIETTRSLPQQILR